MSVTARIAGFLLLFLLVIGKLSNAYLAQGGDDYAAGKWNVVSRRREAPFTGTQITIKNKIRGRKMMSDHDSMKIETNETGVRAKDARKSRILSSRENHEARFVAFNADYKGPRHHPPKNN
ncbi:hypothetical protein CDL12_20324 [Handroanthus impetiginosus]|uniref:Uncharacterized protein n=1 Tax=Handroanthus impetiginosus TaxID=429701 RepID=A0A2G9GPD1_9LAMI|nr:hypothetical protein CDL12_20324 [Handroanthus impetiginosus]